MPLRFIDHILIPSLLALDCQHRTDEVSQGATVPFGFGVRDGGAQSPFGFIDAAKLPEGKTNVHHDAHSILIVAKFALTVNGLLEHREGFLVVAHGHEDDAQVDDDVRLMLHIPILLC